MIAVMMATMPERRMKYFQLSKLEACCSSSTMKRLKAKPKMRKMPMMTKRIVPMTLTILLMVKYRIPKLL